MKKIIICAFAGAILTFVSMTGVAQTKQRIRFPAGTHGTSVKGTVHGYEYRDYVVGAAAGQAIDVRLTASQASTVLAVFLPNGDNLDGASETTEFKGELTVKGNYVIRVLMMRSAARRKAAVSSYTLAIGIR